MKNNKRLALFLVIGVVFMFGFSYMLVPLYSLICKREGINGKSVVSAANVRPDMQIDYSRTIKIELTTTLHNGVHFEFIPLEHHLVLHPGETKLIYFYAHNNMGKEITVQAIPSITPMDAARFLKKTQCFCFTQQYFFKDEKAKMPVYFFVDPEVPRNIKEVTLSYTLFDATEYVKKNQQYFTQGRIDL